MRMNTSIEITLRKNLKISDKPKPCVLSFRSIFFFIITLVCLNPVLSAQVQQLNRDSLIAIQQNRANLEQRPQTQDTIPGIQDSVVVNVNGIETTIKYFAKDSIITKISNSSTYLYGDAVIEYGRIKLTAAEIIIDQSKSELTAKGVLDSLGNWQGRPVFNDGPDRFETEEIRYNFVTQKARIKGVATQQPDGLLRGEVVKRNPDQSAYVLNGKFIPCLDNPNATTYINAKKIKINPGKNIITGPFLLYVGGIPTPLGLPFGFFPDTQEVTSGILFPKYGDERRRGLFLRQGGWYQVWNDQVHSAITGDIYSKGSWALSTRTVYRKRYKYSGQLSLTYNRNRTPDTDEVQLDSKDFWLAWSHSPDATGKNSRFSASVNAGTGTYNQNNFSTTNFQNNVRSEFRSNIQYSGSIPRTPFSYSLSARHTQNIETNVLDVSLPEGSFNMNRVYPFKGSKADILKSLNVGWRFQVSNRLTNVVRPGTAGFNIANAENTTDTLAVQFGSLNELLKNAKNGARHNVDLSTSFSALNYLNVTPSINFEELWYLQELDYQFLDSENAVRIDTTRGFSRSTTYSASVSMSTQVYGMYTLNRSRKIEAIRHTMIPTMSFSYRPDFSDPNFGYYRTVQTDTSGTTRQLSIYDGFRYGSPSLGESAALSFSVSNQVEMKVRSDTAKSEKVKILENLSLNGAYNFLADSFNLSNINITARTTLFDKKLNINMGATLDPYSYLKNSETGNLERRSVLAWKSRQGIGRITSARLALSTNLNSQASAGPARSGGGLQGGDGMGLGGEMPPGFQQEQEGTFGSINDGVETTGPLPTYLYDPNACVAVSVTWNLTLSFDSSYRWTTTGTTTRQAARAYGQIALTPQWDITFNSGYDFVEKELTQTSLGIYRDLGCWEMSANWIPFGAFTSYTIDIQIKASALKDLKISRRRSQFDNNSNFGVN